MTQSTALADSEREFSDGEEVEEKENVAHESDNARQSKTVRNEELKKWEFEKERYNEIIEYIKEVDEILNLIRPFPRDDREKLAENPQLDLGQSGSQSSYKLDHLGNIIKLVEQLKQLQESNSKVGERPYCLKDLKKLREHKRRLKNEELEWDNRSKAQKEVSPEGNNDDFWASKARKISSTASEKLENESEGWQHKRKSLCLPPVDGLKSKVSRWTKVKEAFHWEKPSALPKPNKKDLYHSHLSGEKHSQHEVEGQQPPVGSPNLSSNQLLPPPSPPPPPPPLATPPPIPPKTSPGKDLLSVRNVHDFPSSSSSDRLEDYFSEFLVKGTKYKDSESSSQLYGTEDNDDFDKVIGKSFSEEFPQNLCKEDSTSQLSKSNKTTWGKVKDIIQTRKDSLKKKPKKRGSDEFKKRRKLSCSQYLDQLGDLSSPEEKTKNLESPQKTSNEFSEDSSNSKIEEKYGKKLMPALTVTLPSTEELRNLPEDEPETKEAVDEEKPSSLNNYSCQAQYCEDKTKTGKYKSEQNQRLSKWIKVKRVFLTSGASVRPPHFSPINDLSPTSQNKSSVFFSDMESDELSSGEWIDDKLPGQEKSKIGDVESQLIKEDIKRSYNALQKKLSREFDQKLREWEMKSEACVLQNDSSKSKLDESDSIPKFRKSRESMAVPLPNLNDLSPEFKKKLNDWKKIKTSQSSSSVSSATKDDVLGQNIKIRIGEWQPWRNRSSQKGNSKSEGSSEDFAKKGDEGQSWKGGDYRPPSNYRKDRSEGSTRIDSKRRDFVKKTSRNRISSGSESLISNSSGDKEAKFTRRPTQKMKDFQWVEKELQKIEREKLRLEQEKEKYLEREARLEKMKKTMGTTLPTEEIMVRTPAGFFRFKGISQKFTKKLYEWEKARGIAPEASTFALLEESARTRNNGNYECESDQPLQRSKSTGSVPEMSSSLLIQSMVHYPSSLSLNDFEELKNRDEDDLDEARSLEQIKADSEEPEAVIVEVEDVVEETALLPDIPLLKKVTPVYTYTPDEYGHFVSSDERTCFSVTSKILTEGETKNSQDGTNFPEFTFGKSNKCEATEKMEDKKYHLKDFNIKESQFLEAEDNRVKMTLQNSSHSLELSNQRSEIRQQLRPDENVSDIIIPALTKSPKTFFDWKTSSEYNCKNTSETLKVHNSKEISQDIFKNQNDSEALKRNIKEKISLMQKMTMEGTFHSSRRSGYNHIKSKIHESEFSLKVEETKEKEELVKKDVLESVFIPNDSMTNSGKNNVNSDNPVFVNVFVPTTRKIISPVKTTQGSTPSVYSYVIDDVKSNENQENQIKSPEEYSTKSNEYTKKVQSTSANVSSFNPSSSFTTSNSFGSLSLNKDKKNSEGDTEIEKIRDIGMPPLPHSPKLPKKFSSKETAPSIRMIIAKYNQKISEHENAREKKSDSSSPTMWRSPVFGRRTLEKTEKYKNNEVQKSASLDSMSITEVSNACPQQLCPKGILKSSSFDVMKVNQNSDNSKSESVNQTFPSVESGIKENSPSVLRALRIQKAKEEFLSGSPREVSTTPTSQSVSIENLNKNQAEEAVGVVEQTLVKSISSETVSSDQNSLQNKEKLPKSPSKFDISSIKSKFRKIRMRKEKDSKMNAVAVLCRQSLLIEVPKSSDKSESSNSMSKSCPSSPVMNRNKNNKSSNLEESKPK